MARFRAPSTCEGDSVADINGAQSSANAASVKEPKSKHRSKGKKPKTLRHVDSVRLMNQFKVAAKKQKAQATVKDREWSYVFVGNLNPTVTENKLGEVFSRCGFIERITIRASHGAGVSKHPAAGTLTKRDRCYATVEFRRKSAARAALNLNGTQVVGSTVVVCLSPADLPEVQDIMNGYGWIKTLNAARRRVRPLTLEKTELVVDSPAEPGLAKPVQGEPDQIPSSHRVRWFRKCHMTFPKGIV